MSAGYSGTPLIQKLGIKPGMRVLTLNAPADYEMLLGIDIGEQLVSSRSIPDLLHAFVRSSKEMNAAIKKTVKLASRNNKLITWISWYKKSAGIPTDVTEDSIREAALKHGLVDVKVCAVSEIWSGLKLVVPLRNRS
ncbi:MAG TPA: hypothetical protein VEB63_02880 [Chitinophagaceae bacterium]|nr:hypothetical protein [Chitinophagaceae bacterium]